MDAHLHGNTTNELKYDRAQRAKLRAETWLALSGLNMFSSGHGRAAKLATVSHDLKFT